MKINDSIYVEQEIIWPDPKNILENPINFLQKLGVSPNQTKIYLCLTKMGPKTASQLSKILDFPRTETYHILKTLQEKGFVSTIKQKPLKFVSVSLENFLEKKINLEKIKIKKLEETLKIIKKLQISNILTESKKVC